MRFLLVTLSITPLRWITGQAWPLRFRRMLGLFAFSYAPQGWLSCEGQLLSISQNPALFSLLGTTYGGDGTQNFAVPNLKGKAPAAGMGYYIATEGRYPSRP